MLEILSSIEEWLEQGHSVAIATTVETWGSAPRQAGAKMAINEKMGMAGSVSGGCVETAVAQEALDSLADHKPRLLSYGVSDDAAWDVGLACGGRMSVYVEQLDRAWWQIVRERVQQNKPFTTITIISGDCAGQKLLLARNDILYSTVESPDLRMRLFEESVKSSATRRVKLADALDVLADVSQPAPHLIIIGGAHVAMALNEIAHVMGFRVVIIDPRRAFATSERFPNVEGVSHLYPDKALPEIGLNADSYIAVLTHDPKIDDPALMAALPSTARYIGVLSSKRTHEKRIERLTAAGVDPALLKRIHTPIGLEIGARTPEEIALCIMAEIVAVRNGTLP